MRVCREILVSLLLAILFMKTTVDSFARPAPSHRRSTRLHDTKGPILVVGGTGRVGRLVVQQLKERDIPVRLLVRDKKRAQELLGAEEVRYGRKIQVV